MLEVGKLRKEITSVVMVCLILASVLVVSGVAAQPSEKVAVIVGFKGKPDTGLLRAHNGDIKYEYSIISAVACSLPQMAIDALKRNPNIAYIELDGQVYITQETLPWGIDRIDAEVVHPYNKGEGVKVAIIDTGIDYDHPDLDGNYEGGFDFVNNDYFPMDDNGHGTHCAGIVAGEDNDIGVIGVAPEAWLYAVKVLDAKGSGYVSDVVAGIQWSIDNGMQIISMSLGSSSDSTSLRDACDGAYNSGILLFAAAGNSGNRGGSGDNVLYPARYSSVIAVGATDKTDKRASWSSTGSALELAAPGVSIYSTYWDNTYATLSGTSMACPHVAGTAALVFKSNIDFTYDVNNNGSWDASEVRKRLRDTADDLGVTGWDSWYGYGLVDADEAAAAPSVDTTPPTISGLTPADGALINTATSTISATVADASGIDADSIAMTLDESPVVCSYDSTTSLVYYVPATLTEGLHTVKLDVSDMWGNPATASWSFTVDTSPPLQVTGVTVTPVSSSRLDVKWTANVEPDLNHYKVYRSTTSGGSYNLVASPTTNYYSDTGLTASTTYYYKVSAVDKAGNEGTPSSGAEGTTGEAPALPTMHVASIDMWYQKFGQNYKVYTKVTIVDGAVPAQLVSGATVYLELTLPGASTTVTYSGVTGADGTVTFTYGPTKNRGTYTSTVTGVVLTGWIYDPGASVTSKSITV